MVGTARSPIHQTRGIPLSVPDPMGEVTFTLSSWGPDGIPGTADDVTASQNNDQMRSFILRLGKPCP